jgi:predicted RNA-binding protein Jag
MGAKGSMFEGKTLDDAVRKGLETLGLTRAEVIINVAEEGSGGFLGLGARPYKVIILPRPGGPPRDDDDDRDRERRGSRAGRGGREARGSRGGRGEGAPRGERNGRGGRGERRTSERPAGDRPAADRAGGERPRSGDRPDRDRAGRGAERGPRRPDDKRERSEARPPAATPAPAPAVTPDSRDAAPEGDEDGGRRRRRGRRGGRGRRGERSGPRPETPALEAQAQDQDDDVMSMAPQTAPAPMPRMEAEPESEANVVTAYEPAPAPVVRSETPAEESYAPRSESRRSEAPLSRETEEGSGSEGGMNPAELAASGKQWTEQLMQAMGFDAKVTAVADADRVDVTVEVAERDDLLTGPKGEVRQAMQHLLNRMVNRGEGSRYHLQLEINDFWQQREDELRKIAADLAAEALEKNDEVVTEYLNSQERRIIHMTLREDARVKTYALGTGLIKRVAIAPADFPEGERADD